MAAGTSTTDADVVVVGGGPAGAATAIAAATRGLRVVMLDAGSREPAPGETLHPGVEPILDVLGVGDRVRRQGFVRHAGLWVTWGEPRRFVPYGADARGAWLGFQAWRPDLDRILADRAVAVGVRVIRPCRALAPLRARRRVTGVRTSEGDVTARFTVDATGGGGWLGRHLGLDRRPRSAPLLARFGYRQGRCPDVDEAPSLDADADGWTWTARVRPGVYAWTRLDFGRARREVPALLAALEPLGRARGADVTWRITPASAGPGYFLVGDAAAVLDPASSHGVLRALMSGIAAGTRMASVRAGRLREAAAYTGHRRWLSEWFARDTEALADAYDRVTARHQPAPGRGGWLRVRGRPGRRW